MANRNMTLYDYSWELYGVFNNKFLPFLHLRQNIEAYSQHLFMLVIISWCPYTLYPLCFQHKTIIYWPAFFTLPFSPCFCFFLVVPTLNRGRCCCVIYLRCSWAPFSSLPLSLALSAIQISLLIKLSIVLICWAWGICWVFTSLLSLCYVSYRHSLW